MKKPKVVATIEARMTSRRLPGKILKPILGKPSLEREIERLKRCKSIDQIVVATTSNPTDDPVEQLCRASGVAFYRGSEDDVLLRVLQAAQSVGADVITEITGDCPLLEPAVIDACNELYQTGKFDYVSNFIQRSWPRGINAQIFSVALLDEVNRLTSAQQDHEHVSLYIYSHPEKYRLGNLAAPADLTWPDLRLTLDTPEDYALIQKIYEAILPVKPEFTLPDILAYLRKHPDLVEINRQVQATRIQK